MGLSGLSDHIHKDSRQESPCALLDLDFIVYRERASSHRGIQCIPVSSEGPQSGLAFLFVHIEISDRNLSLKAQASLAP